MLFSAYSDDKFMFVHRVDEQPDPENFPLHAHSCVELIYLISGDISFTIEGIVYNPKPRDIMIFDRNKFHKTNINSNKPYERIVIRIKKNIFPYDDFQDNIVSYFNKKNFSGINLITPNDFKDSFWERSLKKIIDEPNSSLTNIISNVIPFLNELKYGVKSAETRSVTQKDDLLNLIITYINANLNSDIQPDDIAEHFFISRSKLDKLFRNSNGSSVCEYITLKRLHLAKSMLNKGLKPTKIYLECGFRDYTTFYRCYKSTFGASPKVDMKNTIKQNINEDVS